MPTTPHIERHFTATETVRDIKGRFTTNRPVRSGWQTVLVGGVAAAAAFRICAKISYRITIARDEGVRA
jgi:hypothetical protein